MKKRTLIGAATALSLLLALGGCNNQDNQTKTIKVGATAGPHAEVVEAAAKVAHKAGLTVKLVEFSDYITPDKALAEGSIDLAVYQHQPFLDNFNTQQGTKLVSVGNAILMRMGIYSNKTKNIRDLKKNAVIAIPNDPTNGGRALLLLQNAGLIKLKDNVGFNATRSDIVANPKNLQLKELEAAQLPRSLDDVDAAVITMNYVMSAGLDPSKQGIFLEPKDAPLAVMIIAANPDNQELNTIKAFVKAYQSDEVNDFIKTKYKGTIEAAWK